MGRYNAILDEETNWNAGANLRTFSGKWRPFENRSRKTPAQQAKDWFKEESKPMDVTEQKIKVRSELIFKQ